MSNQYWQSTAGLGFESLGHNSYIASKGSLHVGTISSQYEEKYTWSGWLLKRPFHPTQILPPYTIPDSSESSPTTTYLGWGEGWWGNTDFYSPIRTHSFGSCGVFVMWTKSPKLALQGLKPDFFQFKSYPATTLHWSQSSWAAFPSCIFPPNTFLLS